MLNDMRGEEINLFSESNKWEHWFEFEGMIGNSSGDWLP